MSDDADPAPVARRARVDTVDATDSMPFSRGVSLFDAVYGFAMTLLIANVDPPPEEAWESLDALMASGASTQFLGFALSFVVIAVVWRANVRLMRRLSGMDGPVTALNLLTTALVIIIAFTTQGISDPVTTELALPTALYALNIAAVSSSQVLMYQVARARGLEDPRRTNRQNRFELLAALTTPVVFLASVPVALFVDANTAKLTWLILVVLNPLAGIFVQRRTADDR
ncbi:TMEM175 family protein [Microbacterium sp. A196]|uniref:TMEM175 family protein n=1 Tax=unclassified Microbacterium TaxID=2609290 RepID=UPI003FD3F4B5